MPQNRLLIKIEGRGNDKFVNTFPENAESKIEPDTAGENINSRITVTPPSKMQLRVSFTFDRPFKSNRLTSLTWSNASGILPPWKAVEATNWSRTAIRHGSGKASSFSSGIFLNMEATTAADKAMSERTIGRPLRYAVLAVFPNLLGVRGGFGAA